VGSFHQIIFSKYITTKFSSDILRPTAVMSDEYRHVPTGILARLAQRLSKVFASLTTWYRLLRSGLFSLTLNA